MLPIHEELSKLDINKNQIVFGATSLYPPAIWDYHSICPEKESGYTFESRLKDICVNDSNVQTFNQDGNDSAIIKIKLYNTPSLTFLHLPIKEKVKNRENNRMRIGYITDTLTSVVIQEIGKMGGKLIEFYEGVIIERTSRYRFLEKL